MTSGSGDRWWMGRSAVHVSDRPRCASLVVVGVVPEGVGGVGGAGLGADGCGAAGTVDE
jgi:hypothetical protein